MFSRALYYPYIHFTDVNWLKAMSMFYERIYRIAPKDIIPIDAEVLQPLLEDGMIGRTIDPVPYSEEASSKFLSELGEWAASALVFNEAEHIEFTDIHNDKTDERVRNLFKDLGYKEEDKWYSVPTELSSNYMLYLAREISNRNKLCLITNEWAPWTATTYFSLNGKTGDCMAYESNSRLIDDPYALFSLILGEISPLNISEIPSEKIVEFRIKRKDEISNFRNTIYRLYNELQNLEDPQMRYDVIRDKIVDLEKAKDEYRRSADIIKAKGWMGFFFLGFSAPVSIGRLFDIPTAYTVLLSATGLAIGGIFHIKNTREELKKLQKENEASFLVNISKDFSNYTSFRGGGDANFHACNCMEEYVND